MWRTTAQRLPTFLLLLAPGLFAGRVLSELLHPGLPLAIGLTLLTTAGGAYILRRQTTDRRPWSALALYGYILYPAFHPGLALAAGAIAVIATLITHAGALPRRLHTVSPRSLAANIFILALLLYWHTLSPDVLTADNGELQLVATRLGVAHPPGFALYTLLAHLATQLPLGSTPAYRANFFSAIIAASTLSLVFLSAARLTRSRLAGLVTAIALGTATTFWAQATTANVRMLAAFFTALAVYLLLLVRSARLNAHSDTSLLWPVSDRATNPLVFLLALTLSLGVTHHASLIFMAFVFGLALLRFDSTLLRHPRRWGWLIAGLLLGLLPLLYFPIRAITAAEPVRGVTPALATPSGFLEHILALGFRGDLFAYGSPQELWARLQIMGNVMTFQFHWILLLGMVLGFVVLLRRQPTMGLALGGAFLLHTLVTAAYRAPQTVEYMLPAYVPAVLLLAAAVRPAARVAADHVRWQPRLLPANLIAALLLVAAVAQGLQRYASFTQLSEDQTAREYAADVLQDAPRDSVVLAGWHWATPLWYLHEVEGQRPDLDIRYVFPTAEPYGETWARRVAENLDAGYPVVATNFDQAAYEALPPPEPLGDAFLFRQQPRDELPDNFLSASLNFGDQIDLLGYRLNAERIAPAREAVLTVAWRPASAQVPPAVTLFVHVVNAGDGAIYGQSDVPVQPAPEGITLSQLRFTPRLNAPPGDYQLYVGAYESTTARPLAANDGAERTFLETLALEPMQDIPFTAHRLYTPPDAGERQLVGYDWDYTLAPNTRLYLHWRTEQGFVTETIDNPSPDMELPLTYGSWGILRELPTGNAATTQYYVPLGAGITWTGEPQLAGKPASAAEMITLVQRFAAARPLQQDLVVSVRLIGYQPDGVLWDWWDLHDSVPALGAIPTLKWIAGSHVRDPHMLTVAPAAPEDQTLGALVTLYDAFTQRPLPILDERIAEEHLGIPLGLGRVKE